MNENTSPIGGLLNRTDAARYLSMSPATLDEFRRAGKVLSVRHGGRWMYSVRDLDSYISGLETYAEYTARMKRAS